jgi:hypothetical protein
VNAKECNDFCIFRFWNSDQPDAPVKDLQNPIAKTTSGANYFSARLQGNIADYFSGICLSFRWRKYADARIVPEVGSAAPARNPLNGRSETQERFHVLPASSRSGNSTMAFFLLSGLT